MDQMILVADDEPFILRTLSVVLEKAGYAVRTAVDGAEALDNVRALEPVLVFVDAMMPKLNGYEVCNAVRHDPKIRIQPHIIMLTARGQEADRDRAREVGIDDFMTKPFSPSMLLERVREICK
jgi:two-component system alkaline phosphatase synthesis response regulator PhoP